MSGSFDRRRRALSTERLVSISVETGCGRRAPLRFWRSSEVEVRVVRRNALANFAGMRSLAMSVCCLALAAPAAQAAQHSQVYFGVDGNPALSAFVPAGEPETTFVEWRQCDGATCIPVPDSAYERREPHWAVVSLGETAAGTSFEAVYSDRTVRTPPWTGRMGVSAVGLAGDATVGGSVTFVPPTWSGGWAREAGWGPFIRYREIIACRTATGGECWVLDFTDGARPGELDQPVRLDARWAGWYLFATEARAAADVTVLGYIEPPYSLGERVMAERTGPGITTVSPPLGPISQPSAAPAVAPVPASPVAALKDVASATIRTRALRRHGRLTIATVTCPSRCAIALKVTGKFRTIRRNVNVTGTRALTIPVRRGRMGVRVTINGRLAATGHTRAR